MKQWLSDVFFNNLPNRYTELYFLKCQDAEKFNQTYKLGLKMVQYQYKENKHINDHFEKVEIKKVYNHSNFLKNR